MKKEDKEEIQKPEKISIAYRKREKKIRSIIILFYFKKKRNFANYVEYK